MAVWNNHGSKVLKPKRQQLDTLNRRFSEVMQRLSMSKEKVPRDINASYLGFY